MLWIGLFFHISCCRGTTLWRRIHFLQRARVVFEKSPKICDSRLRGNSYAPSVTKISQGNFPVSFGWADQISKITFSLSAFSLSLSPSLRLLSLPLSTFSLSLPSLSLSLSPPSLSLSLPLSAFSLSPFSPYLSIYIYIYIYTVQGTWKRLTENQMLWNYLYFS